MRRVTSYRSLKNYVAIGESVHFVLVCSNMETYEVGMCVRINEEDFTFHFKPNGDTILTQYDLEKQTEVIELANGNTDILNLINKVIHDYGVVEKFKKENKRFLTNILSSDKSVLANQIMAYMLSGNSKNLFEWFLRAINSGGNFYDLIKISNFHKYYKNLQSRLSLKSITAYNPGKYFALLNEIATIKVLKIIYGVVKEFNTKQRRLLCEFLNNNSGKDNVKMLTRFYRLNKCERRNIIKKVSTIDDINSIVSLLKTFTGTSYNWNMDGVKEYLNSSPGGFEIAYEKGQILIIQVKDFKMMNAIGRKTPWCISRNRDSWESYVSCNEKQFILFDFSKPEFHEDSMIGFTTYDGKYLTAAHDFTNISIKWRCNPKINEDLYAKLYALKINLSQFFGNVITEQKTWRKENILNKLTCMLGGDFTILKNCGGIIVGVGKNMMDHYKEINKMFGMSENPTHDNTLIMFLDFRSKTPTMERAYFLWYRSEGFLLEKYVRNVKGEVARQFHDVQKEFGVNVLEFLYRDMDSKIAYCVRNLDYQWFCELISNKENKEEIRKCISNGQDSKIRGLDRFFLNASERDLYVVNTFLEGGFRFKELPPWEYSSLVIRLIILLEPIYSSPKQNSNWFRKATCNDEIFKNESYKPLLPVFELLKRIASETGGKFVFDDTRVLGEFLYPRGNSSVSFFLMCNSNLSADDIEKIIEDYQYIWD